ncbi:hypothetical protein, partial [Xenorhabdus bovienii]|uniref:hypothetical protein n=1 Tax=Xenorhabdus bovienii TaxID=40576 RepID=UPI002157045F
QINFHERDHDLIQMKNQASSMTTDIFIKSPQIIKVNINRIIFSKPEKNILITPKEDISFSKSVKSSMN